MIFPSIKALNDQFGIPNSLDFYKKDNEFIFIRLATPNDSVEISLYGAQVLSYTTPQTANVLWVSDHAIFEPGKAIRGGIPICWPWFGAAKEKDLPSHGFARNHLWDVSKSGKDESGNIWIELLLKSNEDTLKIWPYEFTLYCKMTLSDSLKVELTTVNQSSKHFEISQALHSYFSVSDIHQTYVTGLDNREYIDTVGTWTHKKQSGNISFTDETDRIYINSTDMCSIIDPSLNHSVSIEKENSNTTIVWNPWIEKSKRMKDFGDDEYLGMLCIESANADKDLVYLEPGEKYTLSTTIKTT